MRIALACVLLWGAVLSVSPSPSPYRSGLKSARNKILNQITFGEKRLEPAGGEVTVAPKQRNVDDVPSREEVILRNMYKRQFKVAKMNFRILGRKRGWGEDEGEGEGEGGEGLVRNSQQIPDDTCQNLQLAGLLSPRNEPTPLLTEFLQEMDENGNSILEVSETEGLVPMLEAVASCTQQADP